MFVHRSEEGETVLRLVETEAYRGPLDPGSHGYRGPTARTRTMYGPPGRLYVYFTYGMHWCANVVCARDGVCEAVLLRAGEPVRGIDLMRSRRGGVANVRLLASGPARLAQAMGIGKRHDGATLLRGGRIFCARDEVTVSIKGADIAQTRRVGLAAGRGDDLLWRFVLRGHAFASRRA